MPERMKMYLLFLVLNILLCTPTTWGYGSGAPTSQCKSMTPQHGVEPQTSEPPYKVTLSKPSVLGTENITITLTSDNAKPFKGFFVQVRKSANEDTPYGKFNPEINSDVAKGVACSKIKDSAMTHKDSKEKTSVALEWMAPNDEDGDFQVIATFVETGETFWVKTVHPEKIRVKKNLQATVKNEAPVKARALSRQVQDKIKEVYKGCGSTKGCFGVPGECVSNFLALTDSATEADACTMIATWSKAGEKNVYEISGLLTSARNGYVALGLGPKGEMPGATVAGCIVVNDGASVERYENAGYHNTKHETATLGIKNVEERSIQDGYIFCKFEQTDHEAQGHKFALDTDSLYLLLSRGEHYTSGLGQHAGLDDKKVSRRSVHISETDLLTAENSGRILIQLHGAFMIVAWLLCASTGMFTARYLKQTNTNIMPLNKAFWFFIHVLCMFSTVFFTACGIVFIVVKKEGKYSKGLQGDAKWHPILGIILSSLAGLQVLIAFFRPHPNTPKRPLFNWVHWTIGNSAHIVGIACIFLAENLSLAGIEENMYKWVLVIFVGYHILIHVVMSIHTVWADQQMNSKHKMRAARPGPMKPSGVSDEAPGTSFRMFLLILYVLGVAAVSAALIYFIVRGPKETISS